MKQPHDHPTQSTQKLLELGIALSLVIFFLEFFGGLATHSLALLSDAWHVFIDVWALILSYLAIFLARRPVDDRRTFGLHRMEVLAAFFNGLSVFVIAVGILYAAFRRFDHPQDVHTASLFWIAGTSLLLNGVIAYLLFDSSHHDMNIRSAFIHMVSDALNTVAVLISAAIIHFTGWRQMDPIVSAGIALVVLWGSGRLLYESVNTLLEGVPPGIHVDTVEKEILQLTGVVSVHDLHIWSICSHLKTLSGHVLLKPEHMAEQHELLDLIGERLKTRFGISHTTIQVESNAWTRLEETL